MAEQIQLHEGVAGKVPGGSIHTVDAAVGDLIRVSPGSNGATSHPLERASVDGGVLVVPAKGQELP